MKKLIPLLILLGGAASGFAQGSVTFRNSVGFTTADASGGGRLVYDLGSPLDPAAGVGLLGTQYVAELYSGPDASSLTPIVASISRFRGTTSTSKGKWGNSTLAGLSNDPTSIPGSAPGVPITLQIRIWDLTTGATFDAATGKTGTSLPFTYTPGSPGDPPAKYYMEGMQAFALVPEPSAIALSVMGIAGLLLIRRRK